MDTTDRDAMTAQLANLERWSATSLPEEMQKQNLVAQQKESLNNLIPEVMSPDSEEQWRQVAAVLKSDMILDSSHISTITLPTVHRAQSDRVRLEQTKCFVIRQPLFSEYEHSIFHDGQIFALTGPQGFGKSAFLQYLASKYCREDGYLVVYVPVCPSTMNDLKRVLAAAFYRGCRIAELGGYKELTLIDDLGDMLHKCVDFATSKGRVLLLVIDQMKYKEQELFAAATKAIHSVANVQNLNDVKIRVILSSSTSFAWTCVFPIEYYPLKRYKWKVTLPEAELLAGVEGVAASADLYGEPFQVAVEKMHGRTPSTEKAFAIARRIISSPEDAGQMNAFICLQMVVASTKKDVITELQAMAAQLDEDQFYVEQDESNLFYIEETRKGFADTILTIMQSNQGNYATYLLSVLSNTNFSQIDPGTKGRIVEDCFFSILRSETEVQFPLKKIDGGKTSPASVVLHREHTTVLDVPGGDEEVLQRTAITWPAHDHVFVFIPLHKQYKGIDFIIARKTKKTLYIYYVQCTVQRPQKHPICESNLYQNWEQELRASAGVNTVCQLVFLTPHTTNLWPPGSTDMDIFFRNKTKIHIPFVNVSGSHALLDQLKKRFSS